MTIENSKHYISSPPKGSCGKYVPPPPPSRRGGGGVICTLMEAWKKGLHRLLWQGCVAASPPKGFYFNRCIRPDTQRNPWTYAAGLNISRGILLFFKSISIQHCFIYRPSDTPLIEPMTVVTMALPVRHSNHSARLNIEIPKTGNYFPTCQPNVHSLERGRGESLFRDFEDRLYKTFLA
jgi:hypothetical protein